MHVSPTVVLSLPLSPTLPPSAPSCLPAPSLAPHPQASVAARRGGPPKTRAARITSDGGTEPVVSCQLGAAAVLPRFATPEF